MFGEILAVLSESPEIDDPRDVGLGGRGREVACAVPIPFLEPGTTVHGVNQVVRSVDRFAIDLERRGERLRFEEIPLNDGGTRGRIIPVGIANQRDDVVTAGGQGGNEPAPDEAGRTRDENAHTSLTGGETIRVRHGTVRDAETGP